jgi:hypothetical protein
VPNLRLILLIQGFLLILSKGFSQEMERPMITDRPTQSVSTSVLLPGEVQIESGFLYERSEIPAFMGTTEFPVHTWLLNGTLLRIGIFKGTELRLGQDVFRRRTDNPALPLAEQIVSGPAPLKTGIKVRLYEGSKYVPEIAFLGSLSLPFYATEAFGHDRVAPAFRLLFAKSFGERFNVGANLGADWDGNTALPIGAYTLSVGSSIAGGFSGFIELYGFFGRDLPPDHRWNGGFAWLIKPDFQLDLTGGIGLSDASPRAFLSTGFSLRLAD